MSAITTSFEPTSFELTEYFMEDEEYEEEYEEKGYEEKEYEEYTEEEKEERKKRKEKFMSLLCLNTEESLRGMKIYGDILSRATLEPIYRDGVRVGTSFIVEEIRIDEEITNLLKEIELN